MFHDPLSPSDKVPMKNVTTKPAILNECFSLILTLQGLFHHTRLLGHRLPHIYHQRHFFPRQLQSTLGFLFLPPHRTWPLPVTQTTRIINLITNMVTNYTTSKCFIYVFLSYQYTSDLKTYYVIYQTWQRKRERGLAFQCFQAALVQQPSGSKYI